MNKNYGTDIKKALFLTSPQKMKPFHPSKPSKKKKKKGWKRAPLEHGTEGKGRGHRGGERKGEARSCWPRGWYWMLGGTAVGGGSLTS